ncbi:MAG TPA: SsrA-binding protein SmpB [Candidatus Dormibacteraeota bacterium]|nr:SsrA-binding protein SmpB [Candidatus Dormibacteraeota bacterium]
MNSHFLITPLSHAFSQAACCSGRRLVIVKRSFAEAGDRPLDIQAVFLYCRLIARLRLHFLAMAAAATEEKVLATNRSAFHDYHISTKYEAGIALTGTEVKSVMEGRVQLKDAYVAVRDGEAWLLNAHISPYSHGNRANHDPLRTRKLLLHRREIDRLDQAAAIKGMTLVPTRVYLKNNKVKIEVALAKGKKQYDKRETELRRTLERETRAQLKERMHL